MTGLVTFERAGSVVLFVFGLGLLLCYWPGLSGAATSPRWAFLTFAAAFGIICGRFRITALHVIGGLFVAWALASYLWSAAPLDTIGTAWKLVVIACLFCVAGQCDDLKPFYFGAFFGVTISGVIGVFQLCGYQPIRDVAPDQAVGLFVNRLFLAEAAALVGVALIAMKDFFLVWLLVPTIVMPCERGPIIAFAFVGAISLWRESKIAAVGLALAGILLAIAITTGLTFNAPPSDASASDSQSRNETAVARLTIWRATVPVISTIGRGLGAFRAAAPQPIEGAQLEHPHNELIEIAFETGWIGAALFVAFFFSAIRSAPLSIEGVVLLALMMEACFAFPLHEPVTVAFGALCAGRSCRVLPRAVDTLDRCRKSLYGRLAQGP